MISCTEFIPSYSELFSYLDTHYGHEEVERFWTYLFAPTGKGIPLINYARRSGLKGCFEYWNGTLSEEAADCTRYANLEEGWILNEMHHCPSKGRPLELEKELGIQPYYDYCSHCDYYRAAIEEVGLKWVRFHQHVDKASCSNLLYDPKLFKGIVKVNDKTTVLEIRSKDREYFHPDFHSSLNMGLAYVGDRFGEAVLTDYLTCYTKNVYRKVIEDAKQRGLVAIQEKILDTYAKEKAPDAVATRLTPTQLEVSVAYCPGVRHLRKTGREVSAWYSHATRVVMGVLAREAGYQFSMGDYDEQTGRTSYCFYKTMEA